MGNEKYLTVGSLAAICDKNHPVFSYGSVVIVKKIKGNRITISIPKTKNVYHLHAKYLHNNLMPYR